MPQVSHNGTTLHTDTTSSKLNIKSIEFKYEIKQQIRYKTGIP